MDESLKILLVEDDDDDALIIRELIQEGLPHCHFEHTVSSAEALNRLGDRAYDLCLFDYRLGEVDGIDLLAQVRSKHLLVPIIFLTGQGDQETAVRAMKAGATDYLTKEQLSVETLTQSIRYALGLHREALRRQQAEEMLKTSHEELTRANRELRNSMDKLKKAQSQILRSEKLAGIGRLAAGVCHEILNPLNIISGHVQALTMEREDDGPLNEDMQSILEEIHRIEKIINGLLKFSRKGEVELRPLDIREELDSVLAIIEKEMALDGIEVVRNYEPDLPKLLLDPDRMRQVFLNILNNAKYAMKNGGTLTVTTETLTKRAPGNFSNGAGGPHPFLRITFADTGVGIKKEDLEKIFDPFFTTKPEDKGTGLGLSVCYSIIEKHGGTLEAESEYGKGTAFIIELPVQEKEQSGSLLIDGSATCSP